MLSVEAFRPFPSGTVSISAGTASATALLTTASLPGNISVRVHNNSTATTSFVEFGTTGTLTAITTTSIPIPPGAIEIFNIDQCGYVAAVTASGTGTIYFTKGYGL